MFANPTQGMEINIEASIDTSHTFL